MRVVPQAGLKIAGHVKIYSLPPDFTFEDFKALSDRAKEGYLVEDGPNLVVNAGLNQLAALVAGTSGLYAGYCGVGSSNTAAAAAQTDLQTPITRISVSSRSVDPSITGKAHLDTFFDSATGNGTWLETGLFTASSSGTMFCRKVISSFTKDTSKAATVSWELTFVAV